MHIGKSFHSMRLDNPLNNKEGCPSLPTDIITTSRVSTCTLTCWNNNPAPFASPRYRARFSPQVTAIFCSVLSLAGLSCCLTALSSFSFSFKRRLGCICRHIRRIKHHTGLLTPVFAAFLPSSTIHIIPDNSNLSK